MKKHKKLLPKPDFEEEKKLWEKGFDYVIGIDEVGRGAFAGPLVAGAVLFKKNISTKLLKGVNDSKLLKPRERERLTKIISKHCLYSQIVSIPVSVINKVGIGKANQMAFRKAVKSIMYKVSSIKYKDNQRNKNTKYLIHNTKYFVLVDGFRVKYITEIGLKNQKAIIKGDQKSISIASASIIAKVHRDNLMKNLSKKYSLYNFEKNKGYGTKFHQNAIKKHGICSMHRKNFTSCKDYVDKI